MKVILAQPRGFCAGVIRAIEIVEQALQNSVRRSMCVTRSCTTDMSSKASGQRRAFRRGAVRSAADAITIFSAHGVARASKKKPRRQLPVLNATCPLVTKVHNQGKRYVGQDVC